MRLHSMEVFAMRRWILAAVLLVIAAPAALADRDDRGRGRGRYHKGHHKHYVERPYVRHYGPAYRPYAPAYRPYAYAPGYRPWVPVRGYVPAYYRSRFGPVPAEYYGMYGPVPAGCRRAFVDGYVVDYRPSNFLVINFSRVW